MDYFSVRLSPAPNQGTDPLRIAVFTSQIYNFFFFFFFFTGKRQTTISGGSCLTRTRQGSTITMPRRRKPFGTGLKTVISFLWPNYKWVRFLDLARRGHLCSTRCWLIGARRVRRDGCVQIGCGFSYAKGVGLKKGNEDYTLTLTIKCGLQLPHVNSYCISCSYAVYRGGLRVLYTFMPC